MIATRFSDPNRKISIFRKIYLYWKYEGRYIHTVIWAGIKNLWAYSKIIWKDRDYDSTYLLLLLQFKLQKMADYHESRKFYEGWENNVKWMRTSSKLIQKLIDSDYEFEVMKYYDIEMYERPYKDELVKITTEITKDDLDTYLKIYPLQFQKVKDTYKKIFKKDIDLTTSEGKVSFANFLATSNHDRAQTLLFKIINTHLQKWWD